jgi:hypothetical protein
MSDNERKETGKTTGFWNLNFVFLHAYFPLKRE